MKLIKCIEIGNCCGLKMLGECVNNIILHWPNIFEYEKTSKEITELEIEAGIWDDDTPISAIVDAMNWEWYYNTEEDKVYGFSSLREKVCWTLAPGFWPVEKEKEKNV